MKTKAIRGKVKSYVLEDESLKAVNEEGYDVLGYANKTNKDRYAEIVDATAFASSLATFNKNPVMLYMHDPTQLIGNFPVTEMRHDGLFVKGKIGRGFEPAETARKQVEQGILKAMSIGFIPKQMELDPEDKTWHIRDLELLEISLVSIPANQEALFEMDSTGKHTKTILLSDDQAELPNEELARQLGIDIEINITNTAGARDASVADNSSETTPPDPADEGPSPTTDALSGVDFSELALAVDQLDQIGQALGTEEIKLSLSQLTANLQATEAKLQLINRRLQDVEKALVALIGGEITALERERRISRAA